jgi:hypothetical protein
MADLLHHLAEMRCTTPAGVINNVIDPAERAAFPVPQGRRHRGEHNQ